MKYLLDTHVFLWCLMAPEKITTKARDEIESEHNIIYCSMASLWELQIKVAIKKLALPKKFWDMIEPAGFEICSISIDHLKRLAKLPLHHRDPFDRLIIAQAQAEQMTLISKDKDVFRYDVSMLKM